MKKVVLYWICLTLALTAHATDPKWISKVGCKNLTFRQKLFSVNRYGAVGDGNMLTTTAIQKAIDACAQSGGGTVVFEPGKYLTGSLFVKSGVNLQLDTGVELLGSQDIKDYPEMDSRIAGIEMRWPAALINIVKQKGAAVTGNGTINAQGKPFWDYYWKLRKEYEPKGLRWIVDYDAKRPRTFLVQESSDILLKGPTFQQAGFWTVQILYSDHVTIDRIRIQNNIGGHGPSTDGVDIDSSSWVLVQHSEIDCNDDNFCLKAGRDWDGLRVNRPTEYVYIHDCVAKAGAGLITLGSETSGGIRHVWARNLTGNGTSNGLNIKSATTRGGVIEDIHFEDIELTNVGAPIRISMNWNPAYSYSTLPEGYTKETLPAHWKVMLMKVEPAERGIPTFKDVHIANIRVNGVTQAAIIAAGLDQSRLRNFTISNVKVTNAAKAGSIEYAENWKLTNVDIQATDGSSVQLKNSSDIRK